MAVISLPSASLLRDTMSCLVPPRWTSGGDPKASRFELNFRLFFQLGLRRPEFEAAHRYVTYLNSSRHPSDEMRRCFLDRHLGPNWPLRFGRPRLNAPFLVVRALARDFDSFARRGVWYQLESDPSALDEYL